MITRASAGLPYVRRRRMSRRALRENLEALVFVGPWLLGLAGLVVGPMIASVALSLTDWDLLTSPNFVGLNNFKYMASDNLFFTSLYNTVYYTFISVPLYVVVSLLAAMALNVKLRFLNYYRTMLYLPSVTPSVPFALLWTWIFNPDFGLANQVISWFGLPPSLWIWDPDMAKPSFIIMNLWTLGPMMVVFLAGLQAVPEFLHEAAAIDGAGPIQRFRHITIPMLSPVIFFNSVIGIIGSFQIFNSSYIMTQGGPANATLFYVLYLYRMAWESLKMGYAASLAWVLFLIVLAFTLLQFMLAKRWVFYEAQLKS